MTNLYRRLVWVIVFIVIGVVAGIIHNYYAGFRHVLVVPAKGVRVSVYKEGGRKGVPLFRVTSSEEIKIRVGSYDFVARNPNYKYQNPVTKITITHQTKSISINPSFSKQRLASLMSNEKSATHAALLAKYPSLPNFYTITSDTLYKQGDWYGAVLQPNTLAFDRLKVIMQKKGGSWVLAAKPQISIGIPSNPSIPAGVIQGVDKL